MAKADKLTVDVGIGLTLKIKKNGKDTFQNIRPEIAINGIEVTAMESVKEQLARSKEVIDATWEHLSDIIEEKIMLELGQSKKEELKDGEVG